MISILLATYNSSKYLREQLDSIFRQTYTDWVIYAHDDGSTDETLAILEEYAAEYPGKLYVILSELKGLKAYYNFFEILKAVDSEFYMFCDHDDIWLPKKIELSINMMMNTQWKCPNKPILVHTDMTVVDQDLHVINDSFWRYSKLLPNHIKFVELVCCNCCNGCTILFNQDAKLVAIPNVLNCMMHDALLAQSVAANDGIIVAIDTPTVLYRQHSENVIGASKVDKGYFMHKLSALFSSTIENNYNLWKRSCNIKKYSFMTFIYVKIKISILRLLIV